MDEGYENISYGEDVGAKTYISMGNMRIASSLQLLSTLSFETLSTTNRRSTLPELRYLPYSTTVGTKGIAKGLGRSETRG